MLILTNFEFYIPEIFLTVNLLLLVLYSIVNAFKSNGLFTFKKSIKTFSIINLTIALLISLFLLFYFETPQISGGLLGISEISVTIKIIITVSSIIILILDDYFIFWEFYILITLALVGMMIIISGEDLIILYLGIELISLTLYILATLNNKSELSTEAGLKYFIIGAVSSGLLLLGIGIIYSETGVTGYIDLENLNLYSTGKNIGGILIIISILLKLAAAPFHMWAPDVYDGSPTIVTAFFAIVPKIAIFGTLISLICGPFLGLVRDYQELIMLSGALSILIGTFGALNQFKLKRLMAFSAISHIGFLLIGLSTLSLNGLVSTIIYFIIYIIMTVLAFTIILHLAPNTANPLSLLIGLSRINPLLALTFSLSLLSIAGVPPLAGFLSKYYVITSALQNDMWIVTVLAVVSSMISAFYYLQLIKFMWFKDFSAFYWKVLSDISTESVTKLSVNSSMLISISTYFILTALFYPTPWLTLANLTFIGSLA